MYVSRTGYGNLVIGQFVKARQISLVYYRDDVQLRNKGIHIQTLHQLEVLLDGPLAVGVRVRCQRLEVGRRVVVETVTGEKVRAVSVPAAGLPGVLSLPGSDAPGVVRKVASRVEAFGVVDEVSAGGVIAGAGVGSIGFPDWDGDGDGDGGYHLERHDVCFFWFWFLFYMTV